MISKEWGERRVGLILDTSLYQEVVIIFHYRLTLSCVHVGWWFVNVGENEGWAPCSYMETLNGQEEEEEITFIGIYIIKHLTINQDTWGSHKYIHHEVQHPYSIAMWVGAHLWCFSY